MQALKKRKVFFVSDRTGLTAESYGSSLLAQFPGFEFESIKHAYVDSEEQALITAGAIERIAIMSDEEPIVFSTLVEPEIQAIIENTSACVINLFGTFLGPLEECLGEQSAHTLGKSQDVFGRTGYAKRLDAIDYALAHDDGVRPDQYDEAEIILVGVSRSGKTPTCLLLAMNHSISACNYPLTEDELDSETLPAVLLKHRDKLIGLTIAPGQLSNIREKRRPGSKYASLNYCRKEVKIAEEMFVRANIPYFESTDTSIEELAGSVIRSVRTLKIKNNPA
ncbi:MAG TPA: kinase/pyrophosphorylase [Gammaproteobacteria bacterium]|nr:kinase/pyrophosphorylase [Gammaproteobacteria bacterium]